MDPWFPYWKYRDKRWGIHLQTCLHPAIYVTFIDHDLFCVMSWDKEMKWMEWNSVDKGNVKSSPWHQVIKEIKCTTYSEEAKMILIDVWRCCSLQITEIIIKISEHIIRNSSSILVVYFRTTSHDELQLSHDIVFWLCCDEK